MWLLTDIYSSILKIIATNFQEMSLRPKKHTCVSGSQTDPKKSGPTHKIFSKKNPIFRIINLLENWRKWIIRVKYKEIWYA